MHYYTPRTSILSTKSTQNDLFNSFNLSTTNNKNSGVELRIYDENGSLTSICEQFEKLGRQKKAENDEKETLRSSIRRAASFANESLPPINNKRYRARYSNA